MFPPGVFFELCACPRHDKHGGKVHNIKYQAYPALPAVKPLFDQRRQQQDQCHQNAERDIILAELFTHRQAAAVH